VVVLLSLAAGLGLGLLQGPFASSALKAVLVASAALGTVYSVPPFRLKRFPVLAAFCIIAVRGSIVSGVA
jgi:homogentisate phytyltransferase/homogentisate geranylgeranyltransferase